MPVTCKRIGSKWRVVDPDGSIAKNDSGTAVDGGGHDSRTACQRQARAINAHASAPLAACCFEQPMEVFADEAEPKKKQFRIVGYSGEVIANHWYWGNLAFDLQGLKFAKKRTPILESHNTDRRVGFTTRQEISERVTVEGPFLSNARAQELHLDMTEGFPMQASLSLIPQVVERVAEKASIVVNGHRLNGPGTVFRQAKIPEISITVFGADDKTSSTAFSGEEQTIEFQLVRKELGMGKEEMTEMTAQQFAAEFPDVHAEVVAQAKTEATAEAREAEQRRFADLRAAVGDDPALLVACFAEGKDVTEALKMRNATLAEENRTLREKGKVDPVEQEFQNEPPTQPQPPATTEEGWRTEFEAQPALKAQFGDIESYIAYRRAEADGRITIHGQ